MIGTRVRNTTKHSKRKYEKFVGNRVRNTTKQNPVNESRKNL